MADISVKGSVLRSRLALVDDLAPEGGRDRVLARLTGPERATMVSLLAASWYPFELGKKLDEAIVAELGGGRADFFEKLGEASAEKNLGGVHRSFLVAGDPQAFLAKAPMIYSYYYDKGRRTYEKTGEREAVLTTHDAETFSAPDCLTVVGWYRRALEMCGAAKARVVEEECRAKGGAVCRYRLSWS
ncbi:MAG: TIGR02265 family protein [Vicinamibacteria bacterium]